MRTLRSPGLWVAAAVIVALGVTAAALSLTGGAAGNAYRLERVGIGDVTEAVSATGTVQATNQANANFGASGTVASVAVSVGQQVTEGQTLAQLDTSGLEADLQQAEANLAAAEARLSEAQSSSSGSSTTSSGSEGCREGSNGSGSAGTSSGSAGTSGLSEGGGSFGGGSGGGTPSSPTATSPTSTTTTTPPPPTTTTPTSTTTTAPGSRARDSSVDRSAGRRRARVDAVLTASTSSGSSASGCTSTSSGDSTGAGAATTTDTQSQVYQDDVTVYEDYGDVLTAQADLNAATLTAPISGTVYQVNIAAGSAVSSGVSEQLSPTASNAASSSSDSSDDATGSDSSTSGAIVIVDTGGYDVVCDVSSTDVGSLTYGDPATATLASSGQVKGTVSSIAPTPTTSSSSTTTTFPVEIGVTKSSGPLYSGTNANVTIQVARRPDVVTVPTSAVRTSGRERSVMVMSGDRPVRRRVHVGAVGAQRTQIISGVKPGQQVVLANLSEPIPTSNTSTQGAFGPGDGSGATFSPGSFGGGQVQSSGGG